MGFIPSSSCVNTTLWMHNMDADKTHREKVRWELHKNAMSYIEQILEATSYETTALWPLTYLKTIQIRQTRHAGHYWRSKDELINDILQWTPTYGCATAGPLVRTYLQKLCADTGCSLEDLPGVMDNRD